MNSNYETIIRPRRSWFYFDWQGLLHYRDLLFLLVRRDFVATYKQSILGPAWFIIQPLLITVVFTIIFGKGIKISTDGLPPTLFYFCALIPWGYFAHCLNTISLSLTANAGLFQKVYFPRLIIPLSTILSNLILFMIQLVTFLGFYFYFKLFTPLGFTIQPNSFLLILPLLLLVTASLSLGVGLWVAALTVKYRDFQYLLGFGIQLWMFMTPIIYPSSAIPEKWRFILSFNPMVGIVESYRFAFFGVGAVNFNSLLASVLLTIFALISGILVFNKVERTFVDTI